MSFALMVAGFLATTNLGRVALAAQASRPGAREVAAAVAAGALLVAVAAAVADGLLDALAISPESFRIAAGLVLCVAGVRTMLWPRPAPAPFAVVLVTPELAAIAVSLGADEPLGRVLAAAAIALVALPLALRARSEPACSLAAQFLAALQLVVGVALGVAGFRDV